MHWLMRSYNEMQQNENNTVKFKQAEASLIEILSFITEFYEENGLIYTNVITLENIKNLRPPSRWLKKYTEEYKIIKENINNKEIFICMTDDWTGVYYDNKLIQEGHSINAIDLLEQLNFNVETKYISVEEIEFPESLDELKADLISKKYNL